MTNTTSTTARMGTIEHVDPNLIVVEANVRTEANLPREFVASIKQNGVLTPILARRDTQGAVIVRTGSKPATVKASIAVAGSSTAASAIVSHSLTLDQAAALIEFEGDDETISDLIEVATSSPEQFAHATQRARDDRHRAVNETALPGCPGFAYFVISELLTG